MNIYMLLSILYIGLYPKRHLLVNLSDVCS
uniref:Uncharacterized protein n=1 Tax=Arundo donax TaxID=35708 RepID=A0A0A9TIT9_ARUDO